jgi:hypothetical protein
MAAPETAIPMSFESSLALHAPSRHSSGFVSLVAHRSRGVVARGADAANEQGVFHPIRDRPSPGPGYLLLLLVCKLSFQSLFPPQHKKFRQEIEDHTIKLRKRGRKVLRPKNIFVGK